MPGSASKGKARTIRGERKAYSNTVKGVVMRMLRVAAVLLFVGLSGCVTLPGGVTTSTSDFDTAKEVAMEPAWVCKDGTFGSCSIKFGLQWRSTMRASEVVLVAVVRGANVFSSGRSLRFNIDGTVVDFTSLDELTDFQVQPGNYGRGVYVPPTNWSSKRYLVDKAFLEQILAAERVAVRVELRVSYVEGIFTKDGPGMARPAFRDFYAEVFGAPQPAPK